MGPKKLGKLLKNTHLFIRVYTVKRRTVPVLMIPASLSDNCNDLGFRIRILIFMESWTMTYIRTRHVSLQRRFLQVTPDS